MIIGLIGDLEGEVDAALAALRTVGERGDVEVAYQLGDLRFGYGPANEEYLETIERTCAEHGIQLFCINGNHENWTLLDELWARDPLTPLEVSEHVTLLPRGHRWDLGGRSFVALGGAPSVNRELLTEGVDWFKTEVIEDEHVAATLAGGPVDVMLTHDSPAPPHCTPAVAAVMRDNPLGWPDHILEYAADGVARLTRAVIGVGPQFLAHGHFHLADEAVVRLPGADHDTRIWSLAARREPGTVRLLDLDTLADPLG